MIYGYVFNGTPIPRSLRKKFKQKLSVPLCCRCGHLALDCSCAHGSWTGVRAVLEGVGESRDERDRMVAQANTGHNYIHVFKLCTPSGYLYGIYMCWKPEQPLLKETV